MIPYAVRQKQKTSEGGHDSQRALLTMAAELKHLYDEEFAKPPTALSSPRLPHLAKCALRLALELPAATPHNALSTLEKPNNTTLGVFGKAGDRQSSTIALSLNISAASLYILHSGSSELPSLCANRIVATLPILSCNTESKIAAVGDAEASPTPTPERE